MIKIFFSLLLVTAYLMTDVQVSSAGNDTSKKKSSNRLFKVGEYTSYNYLDVNNIKVYFQNNGNIQDPSGNWSMEYPKNAGTFPIFAAGFALSGYVNRELRASWMASASLVEDWQPGNRSEKDGTPADANNQRFRIYKYTVNDTPEKNPDIKDWPADLGAPYVSVDGTEHPNGGLDYNWQAGDRPLLTGDQMVWYVINDGVDQANANRRFKTLPLGLEAQVSAFAFNQKNDLANAFFVIYKFINRSSNDIENTIFSVWSDPDLGDSEDDLVGVDTTRVEGARRSLAICYNATNRDSKYGQAPPAVGYDFFLGPIVRSPGDSVNILGKKKYGFKELQMDSFVKYVRQRNDLPDPNTAQQARYYQEGLKFDGSSFDPLTDGVGGTANDNPRIVHPGYPEIARGWIDNNPGDRRMMINTAPFTISSGDTQTIVVGYLAKKGSDNLDAIAKLRKADDALQKVFGLNFKIAGPPPAPSPVYGRVDDQGKIHITFPTANLPNPQKRTKDSPFNYRFFDGLTDKVFKGFKIYQYKTTSSEEIVNGEINKKELLQIDISDGLNALYDINLDDSSRTLVFTSGKKFENESVYRQTNSMFNYIAETDAFTNTPFLPGKTYYFGVSSFGVDTLNLSKVIGYDGSEKGFKGVSPFSESGENRISLTYKESIGGKYVTFDSTNYVDKVTITDGDATVFIDVIDRDSVKTGKEYTILFENDGPRRLVYDIKDENKTYINNNSIFSREISSEVIDGLSIRVKKPNPEVKRMTWKNPSGPTLGTSSRGIPFDAAIMGASVISTDASSKNGMKSRKESLRSNALHDDVKSVYIDFSKPSYAFRYLSGFRPNNFFTTVKRPKDLAPIDKAKDSINWAGYTALGTSENLNLIAQGRLIAARKPTIGVVEVPFSVYDVTTDTAKANWRQLMVGFVERFVANNSPFNSKMDGVWNPTPTNTPDSLNEMVFISAETYDPSLNPTSLDTLKFRRYMDFLVRGDTLSGPYMLLWNPTGDVTPLINSNQGLTITTNVLSKYDKFLVTAPNSFTDNYNMEKESAFKKLTIYPNPYLGDNPAELQAYNRFVSLANVPRRATIRIYNLGGQLVRKLEKDDESSITTWDLKNSTGLYVASGIYLIHVESSGLGSKVLKFALVQRQEQIEVY